MDDVYLEFHQVGQYVKVMAIDSASGIEVSVFGPASTPQKSLERIAVQKLKRRLEREKPASPPQKGIIV